MSSLSTASSSPLVDGFWGKPTANIDWCESNFVHSFYIAETFNTLSNLIYIFTSLYGLRLCFRYKTNPMFHCLYLSLLVIGVGSFMFHGTLQREMQALDELPMIFCVFTCFYVLWRLNFRRQRKMKNLEEDQFDTTGMKAVLVGGCIAAITFFYFKFPQIYSLFFVAFTGMTVATVYMLCVVAFGDHSSLITQKQQILERRFTKEIIGLSVLALLVWVMDHALCEFSQDAFKLHTWWHFLSCMVVCRIFALMQVAFYGLENVDVRNARILDRLYPSIHHHEPGGLNSR
eukprot:CAMPEP_0117439756 /NCGR_PEP_ID=MMETSP0759-20121206/2727_1 /TAXON_ID=63605 /ORGANISM="Percolomonas cosmopolitus, Strain WS" /LENGTH=287 /DNA_ID=CAMNT_0005231477 /DNA_START=116 /DNA_END=979 /DNA_ORIENTATION=-